MDCLGFLLILILLSCYVIMSQGPQAHPHSLSRMVPKVKELTASRRGPVFAWHMVGYIHRDLVPKITVFQADLGLCQVVPDRNPLFALDTQVGHPGVVRGQKLAAPLS